MKIQPAATLSFSQNEDFKEKVYKKYLYLLGR